MAVIGWSQAMMREWHDHIESQILSEIDEAPESNVQMATDLLYAYEVQPEVIIYLVQDMIDTANQSVMYHLDDFLAKIKGLGLGAELYMVRMNDNGVVQIELRFISLNVMDMWEETSNNRNMNHAHI